MTYGPPTNDWLYRLRNGLPLTFYPGEVWTNSEGLPMDPNRGTAVVQGVTATATPATGASDNSDLYPSVGGNGNSLPSWVVPVAVIAAALFFLGKPK